MNRVREYLRQTGIDMNVQIENVTPINMSDAED